MSALTIVGSYAIGGLAPLSPYMLVSSSKPASYISSVVTALAPFIFGAVKVALTGASRLRSAVQTVIIGGVAATAAFIIARWRPDKRRAGQVSFYPFSNRM